MLTVIIAQKLIDFSNTKNFPLFDILSDEVFLDLDADCSKLLMVSTLFTYTSKMRKRKVFFGSQKFFNT